MIATHNKPTSWMSIACHMALCLMLGGLFACTPSRSESAGQIEAADTASEAPANPAQGSFETPLSEEPLKRVALWWPPEPFSTMLECYPESVALVSQDASRYLLAADGSASKLAAAPMDAPLASFSGTGTRTARRGDFEYRSNSKTLGIYDASGALLRSLDLNDTVLAGPLALGHSLLVATSAPELLILDRESLALMAAFKLEALPAGPLWYFEASRRLFLGNRDGSMALYGAESSISAAVPSLDDRVLAALRPDAAALDLIRTRSADLALRREGFDFARYELLGARDTVSAEGFILFRCEPEAAGMQRYYIKDAGERHYLIALFDASGEFLISNQGYTAEAVLEYDPQGRKPYYCAVGFLEAGGLDGRFIVAPR